MKTAMNLFNLCISPSDLWPGVFSYLSHHIFSFYRIIHLVLRTISCIWGLGSLFQLQILQSQIVYQTLYSAAICPDVILDGDSESFLTLPYFRLTLRSRAVKLRQSRCVRPPESSSSSSTHFPARPIEIALKLVLYLCIFVFFRTTIFEHFCIQILFWWWLWRFWWSDATRLSEFNRSRPQGEPDRGKDKYSLYLALVEIQTLSGY